MVKLRKPLLVTACMVLISGFFAFNTNAGDWDKATLITTNQPIEVPGRVLPAGTYMFRLMDSPGNRQIVQVMSGDEMKLYQTILAIPQYRIEASDRPSISFYETPRGSVRPVQSWFYAGEHSGVEFVYPKQRAAILAKVTGEYVPSTEAAVTKEQPGPAVLEKPVIAEQAPAAQPDSEITPNAAPDPEIKPESQIAALNEEPKGPGVETPQTSTAVPEEPQAAPAPATLPKTASPDTLFLLMGLGSAIAAYGIRRIRS